MRNYFLTVYTPDGNVLINETFTAENDAIAKQVGGKKLSENGYSEHTHRCVNDKAKLILFHR